VVGVAWAPKGAKIMVGGKGAIESEEGVLICKVFGGETIDDEGSSGKGISAQYAGGIEAWKSKVRVTLLVVRSMR
jgi:hypothetical protein